MTAASVWETAAIGMAAGAGLPLLAATVTALHFVIVLGYTPLSRHLPNPNQRASHVRIVYNDGQGVLRQILAECTAHQWTLLALATAAPRDPEDLGRLMHGDEGLGAPAAQVDLRLSGEQAERAPNVLAAVPGVQRIEQITEDETE